MPNYSFVAHMKLRFKCLTNSSLFNFMENKILFSRFYIYNIVFIACGPGCTLKQDNITGPLNRLEVQLYFEILHVLI